ncbi:S9 family peptidase [Sutcliffiella horikoshii]|uniref:S9 family peptidase n=1 Tax=Sutcliffiella horikoshii TaxID=79883 RepID=UPI003CE907CB
MEQTLTVSEILNIKEPAYSVHMSISSNNVWLAFCLGGNSAENKSKGVSMVVEGNSQWVCNLKTGQAFPIASEAKSSWAGVWSPDGRTLAFFADIDDKACLWLWDSNESTLKKASNLIVCPFFGFEKPIWSKDGQYIIVKSLPSEGLSHDFYTAMNQNIIIPSDNKPKVFNSQSNDAKSNEIADNSWVNRYRADISKINIATGTSTLLCSGLRPVGMELSKDGRSLAFTSCSGEERIDSQQNNYDLWISSLSSDATPRCVAGNIRMNYGLTFGWADNHSIYYTTSGSLADGGLWHVDTYTHKVELLYKNEKIHLGHDYEPPKPFKDGKVALVANGKLWCFSHDSGELEEITVKNERTIVAGFPVTSDKHILLQTHNPNGSYDGFYKVNMITGKATLIIEEQAGHLPWYEGGSAANEGTIAYIFQDADKPPTLKVFNFESFNEKTIELNPISSTQLGTSQMIRWKSDDRELKGALLLPRNIKKPVPAVIRVYGGSMQSQSIRLFGLSQSKCDNHQLFASRGYAVFLPDLPMSWTNEPADDITSSIEKAVEALVKHPDIDPKRIAIIGHSFGGYSALVAITRLQLFKAAIVSAGIANIISCYTHFDSCDPDTNSNYGLIEGGLFDMGATMWDERARYIRNSPIFDFHKIETPVLIIQGTRDHVCHAEAGPMFSSLKRLDKTAQLVLYDEEHYQGSWRHENIEDYYQRVFEWLEKYV